MDKEKSAIETYQEMLLKEEKSEKLADTMQEEFDKQQERKRKMHLAGQMALEELRHKENGPYFSDILKEMQELYNKKNADYGNSFSETIQEFGFTPAIARINDKFKRIKKMVKDEKMLVNESMRDNLMDIANYCVLTIIELDRPFKTR
jgi:hypothetical protein